VRSPDQSSETLDAGPPAPAKAGRDPERDPATDTGLFPPGVCVSRAGTQVFRYGASILLIAAILAIYRLLVTVNNTTIALSLLLAILAVSTRWGLAEATVASVVAVLGFNYNFLPPVGTLTINDPQNFIAFVAFLVTAVTASQLSARARRRAAEA